MKNDLEQLELFKFLSAQELDSLLKVSMICTHDAHSTFHFQGDRSLIGMVVLTGRITVIKHLPHRKHMIVDFLTKGDWYGLIPGESYDIYPVSLRAEVPTQLLCLSQLAVKEVFSANQSAYDKFIDGIRKKLCFTQDRLALLACEDVEVNLAAAILKLSQQMGTMKAFKNTIEIKISRRELAEIIGTSVESAIRISKNWEAKGIVKIKERGVLQITNIEYLRKLCGQPKR